MNQDHICAAILEARQSRHLSTHEQDVLILLSGYLAAPWPSLETIADECGCSVSTIKRALKRLREIGWITQDQTGRRLSVPAPLGGRGL